jgi:hypothetical protein
MTHPLACSSSLPPVRRRLIAISMLSRFFCVGASLATRSIGYARAADLILADGLTAERIVRLFSSSASKSWREDAAMIVLCGSISRYRAAPQSWSPELEATLARGLIGDAFDDFSDAATRFVSGNWSAIERLALGA